jgi:hypothetical protein
MTSYTKIDVDATISQILLVYDCQYCLSKILHVCSDHGWDFVFCLWHLRLKYHFTKGTLAELRWIVLKDFVRNFLLLFLRTSSWMQSDISSSRENEFWRSLPSKSFPWRSPLLHIIINRVWYNPGHVCAPYITCTLHHEHTSSHHLSMVISHGLDQSPPSHVTVYSTFGQVILHRATLHHTNFSPRIRSIVASPFGPIRYQINTSLYSRQITYTRTFHATSSGWSRHVTSSVFSPSTPRPRPRPPRVHLLLAR